MSASRVAKVLRSRNIVKSLRPEKSGMLKVDELPRSQKRCGKQNGDLSFLNHAGELLIRT
jgi:hypothetical protein